MPTWGGILTELQQERALNPTVKPFDKVRRKYLTALAAHTRRSTILYAANWTQASKAPNEALGINAEDMQGFMEVVHGLPTGDGLDLVLHSPGGSAESAEAIVTYLRTKFSDIRVLVPHAAMSAATMLATASNKIVLGKHSFLGPIDPQLVFLGGEGMQVAAAHAILEQWEMAKTEIKADPSLLPAYLPVLKAFAPALIVKCKLALDLAQTLVEQWLKAYMFSGQQNGPATAKTIAKHLANHGHFKSHGRFIPRADARTLGLVIEDLESDQALQDLVLSVFHATTHTFSSTPAFKLIENHMGKAFIKASASAQFALPPGLQLIPAGMPFPTPPPGQP
jgi:hypothetical protein